jgi:dienelactone hydrolase
MQPRELVYTDGTTTLRGALLLDETRKDRRPGVLVVHGATGLDDHPKERARRLAELGYVALACDLFGDDVKGLDGAQRRDFMRALAADPTRLRARANAGLAALVARPEVDGSRLGAIGFCFGGMVVLELARAGAPLAGVVSFHGSLTTQLPAEAGAVKAKVLVCHGALDPFVTEAHLTAFMAEMRAAEVDWQVHIHGNASHGFAHPGVEKMGIPGVAYHALTDARTWEAMRSFFHEVLAPT